MNSKERKAARRAREESRRAAKREERLKACTFDTLTDMDNLYRAAKKTSHGVRWKASDQKYRKDLLLNVNKIRKKLVAGEEICLGFTPFSICDRGKHRDIKAPKRPERTVHKNLTKNILVPAIVPKLIKSNSANIENRGTLYAIKLLKKQLERHYRKHGKKGYILITDFSNYFANISHPCVKEQLKDYFDDRKIISLIEHLIDVQGDIGLGLGSEHNQMLAVAFPSKIDHMVVETCNVEAYGRYMDDAYAISTNREVLEKALIKIKSKCEELGIKMNPKKTGIFRLDKEFSFLKKTFYYDKNGKVIVKVKQKAITGERHKLKKQIELYRKGVMTYSQLYQSYQSWRGSIMHFNNHQDLLDMDALYGKLVREAQKNMVPIREPQEEIDANGWRA